MSVICIADEIEILGSEFHFDIVDCLMLTIVINIVINFVIKYPNIVITVITIVRPLKKHETLHIYDNHDHDYDFVYIYIGIAPGDQ